MPGNPPVAAGRLEGVIKRLDVHAQYLLRNLALRDFLQIEPVGEIACSI
jgi:hypothetical protein